MAKKSLTKKQLEALKALGNPYAFIEFEIDASEAPQNLRGFESTPTRLHHPPSSQGKAGFSPEERAILRLRGNQYAFIDDQVEVGVPVAPASTVSDVPAATTRVRKVKSSTSKQEFERESRRIFGQYMPSLEKGGLRREHRDFIARNSDRSGEDRFALLASLRKYDLSSLAVKPMFNRERVVLTEEKLAEIESSARSKKAGK